MRPTNIVVFEDEAVGRLHPISTGRPAYAITCGGYRLLDLLDLLNLPVRGIVRSHLNAIQQNDYGEISTDVSVPPVLLVNARVVPSLSAYHVLQDWLAEGTPGVVYHNDEIAGVMLPPDAPYPSSNLKMDDLKNFFSYASVPSLNTLEKKLPLFQYPHDVVRYHLEIMAESLEHYIASNEFQEIADGVFAADDAHIAENVVTNTTGGPVLLESNARVGAHSFLSGPAWLGRNCRVIEHSAVKDAVVLGHTTKIGGEIEASIVEPYTNKQHYGFLGHSYLGSWINMGAGTCNSDLKNTYGRINMTYGDQRVATGMQFLGCIMGDYAKTAINTGIFTGKTIGVCSMVYGFVTTNVPSFVNYARLFGQATEMPPEVMAATQQRMFARRDVVQRPIDIQLLHDMYELTRRERQLADDPLSL